MLGLCGLDCLGGGLLRLERFLGERGLSLRERREKLLVALSKLLELREFGGAGGYGLRRRLRLYLLSERRLVPRHFGQAFFNLPLGFLDVRSALL